MRSFCPYLLKLGLGFGGLRFCFNQARDDPGREEEITKWKTRNSQKLNVPLFKTAIGQRTFYYRTVTLWNSLDASLKLSRNAHIFRRSLRHS